MTPRTPTPPPDDRRMWRKLLAAAHPDSGGTHELFVWSWQLRDVVCNGGPRLEPEMKTTSSSSSPRPSHPAEPGPDRVPFPPDVDFEAATGRALAACDRVPHVYGDVLRLLEDCHPVEDEPLLSQQGRGASYKSLAAIGHAAGFSKIERVRWYEVAESIPLAQRHAGHLLGRLKRAA